VFDGRCFVRLNSRVSNMFDAGMRTTLAQRLVSIVWSVFDQTCFNRLATHFNISMFGHQTMLDGVWSPNISCLSRPLNLKIYLVTILTKLYVSNQFPVINLIQQWSSMIVRDVLKSSCKKRTAFIVLQFLDWLRDLKQSCKQGNNRHNWL